MEFSIESFQKRMRMDFGDSISVSSRRPGRLFQVDFPAFLADGDAASIFVERARGRDAYVVTDLAQTITRISYTRDDTSNLLEQLAEIAERQGFTIDGGAIRCEAPDSELVGAIIGLAQIEACVEAAIRPNTMRAMRADEFRSIVIEALRSIFGTAMEENYHSPEDIEGLYTIDAILNLGKPIAVVAIPSDLEAERAIVNKHSITQSRSDIRKWIAVPRDINRLGQRTRSRLMNAYIALPEFDADMLKQRIIEVAA